MSLRTSVNKALGVAAAGCVNCLLDVETIFSEAGRALLTDFLRFIFQARTTAQRPRRARTGLSGRVVLQVVELTDLGVAALQQLQVKLGRNRAQLRRADAQCHLVHALAPGPEIVRLGLALFGQPGKGALKGVAVGIDQAGQQRAGQHGGGLGCLADPSLHLGPAAIDTNAQHHLRLPSARQPGAGCPQQPGVSHRAASPALFAAACAARAQVPGSAGAPAARAGLRRPCSRTSTSPAAPHARRLAAGRSGG